MGGRLWAAAPKKRPPGSLLPPGGLFCQTEGFKRQRRSGRLLLRKQPRLLRRCACREA